MMKTIMTGIAAVTLLGATTAATQAQRYMRDDRPSYSRTEMRGDYRRGDDRNRWNDDRGANRRGFCPPGQAKKPGRGSAFNC
jgi:Ni/Co efflux regulator RcnB